MDLDRLYPDRPKVTSWQHKKRIGDRATPKQLKQWDDEQKALASYNHSNLVLTTNDYESKADEEQIRSLDPSTLTIGQKSMREYLLQQYPARRKYKNDKKAQENYDKRPLLDPYRAVNELKFRTKQADKLRKRLFISND